MNPEKKTDQTESIGDKKGMETLIICPKCQFVYDIRYLSESCRFDEETGYRCMNCNATL